MLRALNTAKMKFSDDITFEFAAHKCVMNLISTGAFNLKEKILLKIASDCGECIWLSLPRPLLKFILADTYGDKESEDIVPNTLLTELALENILQTVEKKFNIRLAVESLYDHPADILRTLDTRTALAMHVRVEQLNISGQILIIASPRLHPRFEDWADAQATTTFPLPDKLADLMLSATVNITSVRVAPSFLDGLEKGDIIKLPKSDTEPEVSARLLLGHRVLGVGTVQKDALFVVETVPTVDTHINEGAAQPVPDVDPNIRLKAKPGSCASQAQLLSLDIDAGFVEVTAHALQTLAAGDVLELQYQLSNGVTVRVGGKLIASGKLVTLGRAKGVLIEAVYEG